ncbi:MAG: DNA-processing protein DprA [Clostridia bacterium]|nr:DNA-processing protein DprA [Clostridia bacterium]
MTNVNYYLWLRLALGPGAENTGLIFENFSSSEEIYRATETERKLSGVFKPVQIERMKSVEIEETYEVMRDCAAAGVDILLPTDDDYPELLLQIPDYPIVLFVKGSLDVLKSHIPFAVVGTREPADRSMSAASELAKALTKCGFVIVSGGAIGIDAAAHTGALAVGGSTVAVLGCGHSNPYLKENAPLRDVISQNGATISEYPPFVPPHRGTFPIRNRIISGMTVGTAVIEAQIKSGSLITAKHATNQNRDIFAVPAMELGRSSEGCTQLLEDGAKELLCPLDVVGTYLKDYADKIRIDETANLSLRLTEPGFGGIEFEQAEIISRHEALEKERADRKKPVKRDIADPLSEDAVKVYAAFSRDPISIKQLTESVIMPTSSLLGALTELELYGYIELLPNTKYSVK